MDLIFINILLKHEKRISKIEKIIKLKNLNKLFGTIYINFSNVFK